MRDNRQCFLCYNIQRSTYAKAFTAFYQNSIVQISINNVLSTVNTIIKISINNIIDTFAYFELVERYGNYTQTTNQHAMNNILTNRILNGNRMDKNFTEIEPNCNKKICALNCLESTQKYLWRYTC